jgi:hypothetical protein
MSSWISLAGRVGLEYARFEKKLSGLEHGNYKVTMLFAYESMAEAAALVQHCDGMPFCC